MYFLTAATTKDAMKQTAHKEHRGNPMTCNLFAMPNKVSLVLKMNENILCPKCNSDITYPEGNKMVCTQCFHEWNPAEVKEKTEEVSNTDKILDSNGQELHDGD